VLPSLRLITATDLDTPPLPPLFSLQRTASGQPFANLGAATDIWQMMQEAGVKPNAITYVLPPGCPGAAAPALPAWPDYPWLCP